MEFCLIFFVLLSRLKALCGVMLFHTMWSVDLYFKNVCNFVLLIKFFYIFVTYFTLKKIASALSENESEDINSVKVSMAATRS